MKKIEITVDDKERLAAVVVNGNKVFDARKQPAAHTHSAEEQKRPPIWVCSLLAVRRNLADKLETYTREEIDIDDRSELINVQVVIELIQVIGEICGS